MPDEEKKPYTITSNPEKPVPYHRYNKWHNVEKQHHHPLFKPAWVRRAEDKTLPTKDMTNA